MTESTKSTNSNLTDMTRKITTNKKWLEELLDRLQTIRKTRGANRIKELSRLESDILLRLDPKHNEALIDEKIMEATNDLIKKLKKRFPGLTENELLFCAYISVDLSSADIATLKDINIKSVNMTRYRLKKKLRLETNQDLVEFIQTF